MDLKRLPKRHEVPPEYTWNLESVYATTADWEQDYAQVEAMLPQLAACRGTLGRSAAHLLACLQQRDSIAVLCGKVLAYARQRKDEDNTNSAHQALAERAMTLATRVQGARAFIEPEILALPPETLARFRAEEPGLAVYAHYLDDVIREKEHVRSAEVETLLAEAGELARAPGRIFGMLDNADIQFPAIRDEQGQEVPITKARYIKFLESPDRRVRRDAFTAFYATWRKHVHTIAATLAASVKKDVFYARARRYRSALEASLSGNNIPVAVYHNLIATVNRNLPLLHRYIGFRRRMLGLDELHMYDLFAPLVPAVDRHVEYAEAVETVAAAVAPLGAGYQAALRAGLRERWVDVCENEGKTGGAYSGGSYATAPFILLNYEYNLNSMFTLAHELGHSLHAYYTRSTQPPVYGHYTIFVAEVASTLNEALLSHYLLNRTADPQLRLYLINQSLNDFRVTLFRQTMFAEFELLIHEKVERGEPLTAEGLCQIYYDLNVRYHGPEMTVDREIELEWARIPHFYNPFYVYQYATGLSAATALARQILQEGQPAVDRYLAFLKSGASDYPINLLRAAGVDMASPAPVQQALDVFAGLLDQMEAMAGRP